jgi:hypothetical protein
MSTTTNHLKRSILRIGIGAIVLTMVIVGASAISGYGLNVRAFGRAVRNVVRTVADHQAIAAKTGTFRNIIFLHHSVGHNLIEQGSVRQLFTEAGYQFWDHDYDYPGLTDPTGTPLGYSYNVPADNTDPDGLLQIFSQPVLGLPLNTVSALMQHEVIAFKSCYPASDLASDTQLEERKDWYRKIRDTMDQHPDRLFVVMTQPPLNPTATNLDIAARARIFANWLKSDEFLQGHPNIVTFDLFDRLAEGNARSPDFNMLRRDYREGADSHPTRIANETIGPEFVAFVIDAIEQHKQIRSQD